MPISSNGVTKITMIDLISNLNYYLRYTFLVVQNILISNYIMMLYKYIIDAS